MHWDSDQVVVEIIAESLRHDDWSVLSIRTESYPTLNGRKVFPDIVATRDPYCLFAEVKTRLFLVASDLHVLYHFDKDPDCQRAFDALKLTRDFDPRRDKGPCEMSRLVSAAKRFGSEKDLRPVGLAVIAGYTRLNQLSLFRNCIGRLSEKAGISVETWLVDRKDNSINLKKDLEAVPEIKPPAVNSNIVSAVFRKYRVE